MTITASGYSSRHPNDNWAGWVQRVFGQLELTATRITIIYAVFGMMALFLSDVLFLQYFSEPVLSQVQALKGGVEVVLTAGLIFILTRRSRRQVQEATEQVERQRDELSLLHRVFRHNLRNHLNVVQGHAELGRDVLDDPAEKEWCHQIIETCGQIMEYTEQVRRIRKVSGGDNRVQTFDLAKTIHRILREHPEANESVEVTTEISDSVEVRANHMLDEALEELITNAIEHNDAETPEISIELAPDSEHAGMAELRLNDNGPGIPPSEIEALERDRETQLFHTTGVGLWFVDWVISHSEGKLEFTSDGERGTDVSIELLKAPTPQLNLGNPPPLRSEG